MAGGKAEPASARAGSWARQVSAEDPKPWMSKSGGLPVNWFRMPALEYLILSVQGWRRHDVVKLQLLITMHQGTAHESHRRVGASAINAARRRTVTNSLLMGCSVSWAECVSTGSDSHATSTRASPPPRALGSRSAPLPARFLCPRSSSMFPAAPLHPAEMVRFQRESKQLRHAFRGTNT